MNYAVIHEYAHAHKLDYNALCSVFRAALILIPAPSAEVETVEVVGYRYTSGHRLGGKWHYQATFPKWDDRKVRDIGQMDELMTIAQHQRIVVAKDAEVDALKDSRNQYWNDWNEAANNLIEMTRERDELRSQLEADRDPSEEFCDWWEGPEVRRLIGDSAPAIIWAERGWNAAMRSERKPKCLRDPKYDENLDGPCSAGQCKWPDCKAVVAHPARQVGGDERERFEAWLIGRRETELYGIAWAAWQARAALAPAAVVMPDAGELDSVLAEVEGVRDASDVAHGWYEATERVARLNADRSAQGGE